MKRLLLAALLAGSAFSGVPAAAGECLDPQHFPPDPDQCRLNGDGSRSGDCSFDSVRQEDATGQNYEGAIWGFVADPGGGAVSIRCYITVNGAEVGAEASGAGTGFAVATGPISFTAIPEDDVDVCAEINGVFAECFQGEHQQFPPQEVIDAINGIFRLLQELLGIADPVICPELANLSPGLPGVVDIDSEGDVALGGIPFWDCPPHGS